VATSIWALDTQADYVGWQHVEEALGFVLDEADFVYSKE
jgi:hypothetical protein